MAPASLPSFMQAESSLQAIRREMADVRNFQLERLRTFSGSLDKHQELVDEMRLDLDKSWRSIQICKELGEVQARTMDRENILSSCTDLENEYLSLKESYRQTALESRRSIKAQTRTRRHELLATRARGDILPPEESKKGEPTVAIGGEDALQTKTNEVTDALRRTTQVMQAELERSVLSVQMLEESTKTLRSMANLYDTYTSLLTTSSKLVKQLERADWYDRLLIFLALFVFLLVVGFIVKKRVLDKMARGVGWWFGGSFKLVRLGLRGVGIGGRVGAGLKGDGKGNDNLALMKDVTSVLKGVGVTAASAAVVVASASSISSSLKEWIKHSTSTQTTMAVPESTPIDTASAISVIESQFTQESLAATPDVPPPQPQAIPSTTTAPLDDQISPSSEPFSAHSPLSGEDAQDSEASGDVPLATARDDASSSRTVSIRARDEL